VSRPPLAPAVAREGAGNAREGGAPTGGPAAPLAGAPDPVSALRRLALAATPGRWVHDERCVEGIAGEHDLFAVTPAERRRLGRLRDCDDAAFVEAANPAAVLALLDRLERAEAIVRDRAVQSHSRAEDYDHG
jgi:hypothetical protein